MVIIDKTMGGKMKRSVLLVLSFSFLVCVNAFSYTDEENRILSDALERAQKGESQSPEAVEARMAAGLPQPVGVNINGESRIFANKQDADAYIAANLPKGATFSPTSTSSSASSANNSFDSSQYQSTSYESTGTGTGTGVTSILPTPKTADGQVIGLSSFKSDSSQPIPFSGAIPDGYVVVDGKLVKDNEQSSKERMDASIEKTAKELEAYNQQIASQGRKPTEDERRLAAARISVQNRVYVNRDLKPTAAEIEKDAIELAAEWKRDNTYLMPDGMPMSFGPAGVAGWVKSERAMRERFINDAKAPIEAMPAGSGGGMREKTLEDQAKFAKSMREESEKRIQQILKSTGVADPGQSTSSEVEPTETKPARRMVSMEKKS